MLALVTSCSWMVSEKAQAQGSSRSLPPDNEYVVVGPGGHLTVDGQRQRYWAVIGQLFHTPDIKPSDSAKDKADKIQLARRGSEVLLQRFEDLGFNACRLWDTPQGRSGPWLNKVTYTKGDGSAVDALDHFIAQAKKRGMRIWFAGLNRLGKISPEDVKIIEDPSTEAAWKEAVGKLEGRAQEVRNHLARVWDPRIQALGIQRMTEIATHFNQHTGLRYCDDPVFAVWELSNEEWWMRKMLTGQWQNLPDFFRNSLIVRWNEFLREKYGDEARLATAWKELLPGESMERGTILFAPMAGATPAAVSINDAGSHAMEAVRGLAQSYGREDFNWQRGADVIEFLLGLQMAHKEKEAAAIKALGKSTRLSPMIYDTGIGYEIHSQFLHQSADAVAHDAYVNGLGRVVPDSAIEQAPTPLARLQKLIEQERQAPNRGRWNNWLEKPPGIAQGVPWLEIGKVEGKPFLCYETQIQQPAKYRADFPFRIATLAAIQDWDFVCWHYFGHVPDAGSNPRPFDKPLDITTGGHPQGYHYTFDEVQSAMMRAASFIWRSGRLATAARPTQFIFGRRSLFDPATMDYAGSYGMMGMDMMQTTYQYGTRLKIDPNRDDDEVIGPVVSVNDRHTHNPYTPTPEIAFDWKKGSLIVDNPAGVAFTGLLANYGGAYSFENGVQLEKVKIHHPEGIFEKVPDDELYVGFSLYSTDGLPLDQTRRAALSLVSTSFNTGFALGEGGQRTVAGTLPVLVARVEGTVKSPVLDGMNYVFRDWHLQELGSGKITGGELKVPADLPIFFIELKR
ncbi:MAG: hypothetical protein SNJ84_02445 [Verrucomicrobiia bacterium]